jgi:hypothetical protein
MPVIKVTASDILRGKILDEAWYPVMIKGVTDWKQPKPGKTGMNLTVTFLIEGQDGKELEYTINSGGIGFHVPLFCALAGKKLDPKDIEIDTASWMGRKLDAKIKPDIYEGKPVNQIVDFVPSGQGRNQQAPF